MRRPRLALSLLNPRRRLRDRLLAAMVVVALLPMGIFTLLAAVNLGVISRTTVDTTHQTILEDQRTRMQSQIDKGAAAIDAELSKRGSALRGLGVLASVQKPDKLKAPLQVYRGGVAALTEGDSTLVAGAAPAAVAGSPEERAARLADLSGQLTAEMQGVRARFSDVEAVWVVDRSTSAARIVPAIADIAGAVGGDKIDGKAPQGRAEDAAVTLSRHQINPGLGDPGPFWTDPYPSRQSGSSVVTVWSPVGGGLEVGADIVVSSLTDVLVQGLVAGVPGAYPLLVSRNITVIAASASAQNDFGAPLAVGGLLPLPKQNRALIDSVYAIAKTGHTQLIQTRLDGIDKYLFTADVNNPHWVLIGSVPRADVDPDLAGLSRGVDSGIRRIFVEAIPVLIALVLLAFLLATLLARRMVGPVKALTTAAERLAEGHTDEPVPPQGGDEVGDLAASLERMRREINGSRDAILAASRELEQRVAVRTGELRARNEELVALNELAGSLTRSLDPAAIVEGALEAVRAILPVRASRGFVLEEDGRLLAMGPPAGGADGTLEKIASAALAERRMLIRRDSAGVLIGLPMATRGGQLGALSLRCPAVPGGEMAALLMAIANQVGLALRTARLSAEGRDMAVLEERTRLAREIHDTLAQQLTGIVIQLEAAQALMGRDSRRAQQTLVSARDLARSALQEARRSVWDLRPAPLTATGVVAAVELEVARFQERTGIAARMRAERMTPPPALQPQAEVAILRITQQALTNIADHSGATRVTLRLRHVGDEVELTIRDNGRGFDPDAEHHGSFGIVGMSERARLAGGTLEVESGHQRGTTLTVRLPVVVVETERVPA